MNHHHTAKATSWILLFAVLVLLVPFSFVHASVEELLFTFVQTVFGWLVGVGAVVLNYAINTWVIEFGETFGGGIGTQIESTWVIFRDIFNLTFIFGLVYIGFKMILRTDDGQTKRWLVQLIIAALLVNFSLFITKFVIDFSNIIAVEIMNQRVGLFPLNGSTVGRPNDIDLSFTMQDSLNLVTVNDSDVGDDYDGGGYTFIFAMMFLYIVTAFVYFAAGILLVIRGVVLLVLMILSPFLFLGMVLPMFASFSRNLWHTLFKRAFMAPIYIALLYISLEIARGITPGNFSEALRPDSGSSALTIENTAAAFGPFIVIIVLLLMSLIAAQKLGAEGASTAIRVGQNLRQRGQRMVGRGAGAMTAGTAAWGGRKFIGGAANKLAESEKVQNMTRRGGLAGLAGRSVADAAHRARTSSFDARNVGGLGQAAGLGEGKKGGYMADKKAAEKKETERSARYSTQEDNRLYKDAGEDVQAVKEGYDQIIENLDQTMAELANATDPEERKGHLSNIRTLQKRKENIENGVMGDEQGNVIKGADGKPVRDASLDDFNYIRKNNKTLRQNSYAANLERRGQDFKGWGRLFNDQQFNTGSADSIRREMSKDPNQKIIDAIKNQTTN